MEVPLILVLYPYFEISISPVRAMAGMTKEKGVLVPRPKLVALTSHEALISIRIKQGGSARVRRSETPPPSVWRKSARPWR